MFRRFSKAPKQVGLRNGQRIDVVGESFHQADLSRICGGPTQRGHQLAVMAVLRPEADNPYDPNAVAVEIDNRQIGHLSRADAAGYRPLLDRMESEGQQATCAARIVGGWDRGDGDRGHFGVQLDLARPESAHPNSPAPPLNPNRSGSHTGTARSPRLEAGFVDGKHYTDWVEPVKALKREKKNAEALQLLYRLCTAAEAEASASGETLPPWYFEQVAIEERKAGRPDRELAILERYAKSPTAVPERFADRLTKSLRRLPPPGA